MPEVLVQIHTVTVTEGTATETVEEQPKTITEIFTEILNKTDTEIVTSTHMTIMDGGANETEKVTE